MSQASEPRLERLLWGGPVTVLLSAGAVTLVRMIAVPIVRPDVRFFPLSPGLPVFDTVVFSSAAVLLFVKFCRYNPDPVRDYRRLALRVLLISFVPDLLIGLRGFFGGGWPEALTLMTMHVTVWAICVTLLPALVAARDTKGALQNQK